METPSRSSKRLKSLALASLATVALAASLAFSSPAQTEDKPNYPVFPPREKLAFSE